MENSAKKAYLKAQARVDDLTMQIMHTLNCIEAFRQGEDNWGDVGTMSSLVEPLTEILRRLDEYARIRVPDEE